MTEVCDLLARIVEYPTADLVADVEHCIALLAGICPEAAGCLSEFRDGLKPLATGDIEEAYTRLFDFQPDHSLYIGHHLFGEDWRRSMFMAELNHWYGETGFSSGIEMPDHIAILLRFLAIAPNAPEVEELKTDCIVPALSKAIRAIEAKQALYGPVLRALLVFFEQGVAASESLGSK